MNCSCITQEVHAEAFEIVITVTAQQVTEFNGWLWAVFNISPI